MVKAFDLAQQSEVLLCISQWSQELLSVLNLTVCDLDMMLFGTNSQNVVLEVTKDPSSFSPNLVDLCSGMGALSIGPLFMGAEIKVCVDSNALACQHLRKNQHGVVLHHDLLDMMVIPEIHAQLQGEVATFVAGFPCQPFSSQGMLLGQADRRAKVFWAVLRAAFLLQAQALILECVAAAAQDSALMEGLHSLAEVNGWTFEHVSLRLEHQWPMLRHRWWSTLFPAEWQGVPLHDWGVCNTMVAIDRLLPRWGLFTLPEEEDLALTFEGHQSFLNAKHGTGIRLLTPSVKCPTLLHSYANTHRPCACGCRNEAIAISSLEAKGLRGYFVQSARTNMPRFLHPSEASVLLGLPLTVQHVEPPRSALCLLGQVASPLQSLWVYSQLLNKAANHVADLQALDSVQILEKYKLMIKTQIRDLFPFESMPRLQSVTLFHAEGAPVQILSQGAATVAQLAQAECMSLDWDERISFNTDSGRAHSTDLLPFEDALYIRVANKRQCLDRTEGSIMILINHHGTCDISFVKPGSFLFQVLWEHDLPTDQLDADPQGAIYGAEFKLWHSRCFDLLHCQRFPTILMDFAPKPVASIAGPGQGGGSEAGLDDIAVWEAMKDVARGKSCLLLHPLMADQLLKGLTVTPVLEGDCSSFEHLFVAFMANGHWGLLHGHRKASDINWIYWDGLPHGLQEQASHLACCIAGCLDLSSFAVAQGVEIVQHAFHTCGTIAIGHMALALGLMGRFSDAMILKLHRLLLCRNRKASWIVGLGPISAETSAGFAALLVTKGVPVNAAAARAQAAIQKLGIAAVQNAFKQSNVWQALKALTAKPGANFQFVLKSELQNHINNKASTKHGAHISTAKKAKKPQKRDGPQPWNLDPRNLTLTSGHFQDDDEDDVQQIELDHVVADARGIAICSVNEAQPFIAEGKNISSDALALLVTEELPTDMCGNANVSAIRFPAVYVPTGDPLLISGSLIQLGDASVNRHMPANLTTTMDVSNTSVLKVVLYQDELGDGWTQVLEAPIRALIRWVPWLRLCNDIHCNHKCGRFHSSVEDSTDNVIHEVWARRYQSLEGRVVPAAKADIFQVFLRVASSVVGSLVKLTLDGIYMEPRDAASRATDADYSVVWLNGTNREMAMHKLKMATHGLSLVRLKHRYGIRVLAQHEEKTYQELRPGDDFVKVKVTSVHRLHPLPHGIQRTQVTALLKQWSWAAKPLQPAQGTSEAVLGMWAPLKLPRRSS